MGGLSNVQINDPKTHLISKPPFEKPRFKKNSSPTAGDLRKCLIEHISERISSLWNDALNNRTAFTKAHKWVDADSAQYVRLSNDQITIVVMALLLSIQCQIETSLFVFYTVWEFLEKSVIQTV